MSLVIRLGVFKEPESDWLLSVFSSSSESTRASRRDTLSRRFFLWSTMISGSACSWSIHRLPRAKHSEHTFGLSGGNMHLIFRRRPSRALEGLLEQHCAWERAVTSRMVDGTDHEIRVDRRVAMRDVSDVHSKQL